MEYLIFNMLTSVVTAWITCEHSTLERH